ncbi:unnamed protein product [Adineta steineri]|uniref:NAD(P)(+)--arginine ADP-ribosyltransferase n=1 Tax=Adineta steineri TaxID=433720 RepID=A0A819ZEI5_9BILA|nr:unnamed protein product [Adineta steineri]CAF4169566.1 unnamed protein product [Adineta steineri]
MKKNPTTEAQLFNDLSTSNDVMPRRQFVDPNFLLVWLRTTVDELDKHDRDLINALQNIFDNINEFTNIDECIDFLIARKQNNICVILPCYADEYAVSHIHDMPQVNSIFVLCRNVIEHKKWTCEWPKIQGIFKQMALICDSLKKMAWRKDQSSVTVSIISESELSKLDQTFMYTKLLNETLFNIEYNEQSIKDFADYCRKQINVNDYVLTDVNKFQREYHNHTAIYWYTSPSFIYQMLNQALRTQNIDTIYKMGFFIRDLCQDLKVLHQQQIVDRQQQQQSFTFYRGQKLSNIHLEEIMKTKNALLSFNNFLSTTEDRDVAYIFAESNKDSCDFVAVLFEINVDSLVSSAPFACLNDTSYFSDQEREVLFSTHTVFRIHEIQKINENDDRFWQINLKLTTDDDHLLSALTERMRIEIKAINPQDQLGQLFIKLDKFNEAEEIYHLLINRTDSELEKANYSYWIARIKYHKGDYDRALSIHEQVLEIRKRLLSADDSNIGDSYEMIGLANSELQYFSEALSAHTQAHRIREKNLPDAYPLLASSKLNIALAHRDMENYSEALRYLHEALKIYSNTLPPYHPYLATAYENIGLVYQHTKKFKEVLEVHEKAREIYEKSLPSDNMDLGICYDNIASTYECLEMYSDARIFYGKSLAIK